MTRFAWLVLPMLLAACVPDNIATARCKSIMLATGDPWTCTVRGERVEQASAVYFDTESRNRVAHVKIALRVAKGTLRVDYHDVDGDKRLIVTPDRPASLEMRTYLQPQRREFFLKFQPLGGAVEGLTGTVDYSTP